MKILVVLGIILCFGAVAFGLFIGSVLVAIHAGV